MGPSNAKSCIYDVISIIQINCSVGAHLFSDAPDAFHRAQVDSVMSGIVSSCGRIDGVVNCVGSIVLKSAHTTTDEDFEQTLRLNLYSCFNILRPSVKSMMRAGGGSIVFCSSAVAKHGIPNHEAIAAAKAGVVGELPES